MLYLLTLLLAKGDVVRSQGLEGGQNNSKQI